MSKGQEYALKNYRDLYCVELTNTELDFEQLFGNGNPVIVEIGFGMGRATIELAVKFPDHNFLGIEVYPPGIGKVLDEIHQRGLHNLRVIQADAVEVLERMIPKHTIAGFHIFFPDPWPKKRHHKRRLIQPEFAHRLAQCLQADGYIYAVTDWEEYAEQILEVLSQNALLHNPNHGFSEPIEWRPKTSFQLKGEAKQHLIREIWVQKK
ncbi:MAG: tRNA (guanosine(46)-N7)-methyltransferase TrmB [Spirochaetota bacterium]